MKARAHLCFVLCCIPSAYTCAFCSESIQKLFGDQRNKLALVAEILLASELRFTVAGKFPNHEGDE